MREREAPGLLETHHRTEYAAQALAWLDAGCGEAMEWAELDPGRKVEAGHRTSAYEAGPLLGSVPVSR